MESVKDIINNNLPSEKKVIAIDSILSPLFYENILNLSEEEKVFEYVEQLEMEINNGGFDQFFFNSAGDFTKETVDSLNIINAGKTATIVIEAMRLFPDNEVPKDRYIRQDVMDKIRNQAKPKWDELDKQFYKYEDNIAELLVQYVNRNIEHFTH